MSLKTAFELVGERLSHAELKVPSAHLLSVVHKSGAEPCFQLLDISGAVSSSCLIAALALVALCELWCAGECGIHRTAPEMGENLDWLVSLCTVFLL